MHHFCDVVSIFIESIGLEEQNDRLLSFLVTTPSYLVYSTPFFDICTLSKTDAKSGGPSSTLEGRASVCTNSIFYFIDPSLLTCCPC